MGTHNFPSFCKGYLTRNISTALKPSCFYGFGGPEVGGKKKLRLDLHMEQRSTKKHQHSMKYIDWFIDSYRDPQKQMAYYNLLVGG